MDDNRIIDGYAVLHAIRIDGAEQIVAEKNNHYRLYRVERVSGLGLEEYAVVFADRDYLKAMREFTRRINSALDGLDLSRVYRGSPLVDFRLEAEDCVPGGMDADLRGKVVAIKSEVLSPEYRSGSYQLMLAEGGFGCAPNARGQSVFCKELYSGESVRWARADILGVVDESCSHGPKRSSPSCGSLLARISRGENRAANLCRKTKRTNPINQAGAVTSGSHFGRKTT